jgi:hypothetical protein
VTRTIACVGKKLGWEKGFGEDMHCYDACRFESLGRLEVVVDDDRGHQTERAPAGVTWIGDDGSGEGNGPRPAGCCLSCPSVSVFDTIMFFRSRSNTGRVTSPRGTAFATYAWGMHEFANLA